MVVGQLPFNTARCSTMTSQQRRKKLLEQINKGLASVQRCALHGFSTEFKAMMARLLMADSYKRIKIAELIFHPWVTEKGRKAVRSNPLKRLDEHAQSHLIQEVANQIQMDWIDVQQAIKYDPQCNIAGMYNILEYKQMMQNLHGDGITKTLTTETPRTPNAQKPTTPKETFIIRSPAGSTDHSNALKSAPIQRTSTRKKTVDNITPRATGMHLRPSKAVTAASGESRKIQILPKESHVLNTSFMTSKKPILQHNLLRRKELKSSPASKHTRNIALTSRGAPSASEQVSRDFVTKSASARKSSEGTKRFVLSCNKIADIRKISPTKYSADSPGRKRDSLNKELLTKRPQTYNEKKRSADRPLKRKSLLPILVPNMAPNMGMSSHESQNQHLHHRCSPRPTSSPGRPPTRASVSSAPAKSLRKYTAFNCDHPPIENRCYNATGDTVKRFASITGTAKTKNNFLNEPIARSIAGYVAKNIPGKLQSVSKSTPTRQTIIKCYKDLIFRSLIG